MPPQITINYILRYTHPIFLVSLLLSEISENRRKERFKKFFFFYKLLTSGEYLKGNDGFGIAMLVLGVDSVSACEVEFGVWYLESVFRTIANYVEVGCVFVVIRLKEFKDRLASQKDCCLSICA